MWALSLSADLIPTGLYAILGAIFGVFTAAKAHTDSVATTRATQSATAIFGAELRAFPRGADSVSAFFAVKGAILQRLSTEGHAFAVAAGTGGAQPFIDVAVTVVVVVIT